MAVYTEYHPTPRKKPAVVSDMLCWRAMVAPNVVLQKDKGLQRSYAVRGTDVTGLTPEELGTQALRANDVLKKFGGQWMLHSEAQRRRVTSLPQADWQGYAVAAWIDACRRQQLLVDPGSYETQYFMTPTYRPPPEAAVQGLRWFLYGPGATRQTADAARQRTEQEFVTQVDYFMGLLSGMLAECRVLTPAETFTYLHSTVSDQWHPVGTLAYWNGIDSQLGTSPWYGEHYPSLGGRPDDPQSWKVRLCSIMGYPHSSVVGVMQALDVAQVQYRWVVRWQGMHRQLQEGILRRRHHAWVGQEKTMAQRAAEQLGGDAARVTDSSALNKAAELDAARQETGHDLVAYGDFTTVIMVWDRDPAEADLKLQTVRQALQDRGFTTAVETDESTPAWFSTHPGNRLDHVARTPQSSLTLEHLCPGLNAAWRGPERDEYLGGLPWLYAVSRGNTLIRIVNHIRDLGHFLVLGATRAGKSTLLNILRAAWMQYTRAQAMLFDLDGHGRLLTHLLGGAWHDLGAPGVQYAPFQGLEDPEHLGLVQEWLLDLLLDYGITRDAMVVSHLGRGLAALREQPQSQRTMTTLLSILVAAGESATQRARTGSRDIHGIAHPDQTLMTLVNTRHAIHRTLEQFTQRGVYQGLFDAATDALTAHPVQTFEMAHLLHRPSILAPVLRYILNLHVEPQMSTAAPMLLAMDDAAVSWMADSMTQDMTGMAGARREEKVQTYLQTKAKKAVSLGFSTHSLIKVFGGPLGTLLQEACPSRFMLPNGAALEPDIYAVYQRLGLTDPAIQLVARAQPQRDVFFVQRELGQQLVSLPLPRGVLQAVACNSASDHALMDRLLQEEGQHNFAARWFAALGNHEAATFVERYHDDAKRMAPIARA